MGPAPSEAVFHFSASVATVLQGIISCVAFYSFKMASVKFVLHNCPGSLNPINGTSPGLAVLAARWVVYPVHVHRVCETILVSRARSSCL